MEAFCIAIPSGLNNVLGIIKEGQFITVKCIFRIIGLAKKKHKKGFGCSYLKCKVA